MPNPLSAMEGIRALIPFPRFFDNNQHRPATIGCPRLPEIILKQRCHLGEGLLYGLSSPMATWRSGYAAACKAVDSGSNPDVASIPFFKIDL